MGERKRAKDGHEWRERKTEREREIDRVGKRKIEAPTGMERDMVVLIFSLPPYLPLSLSPLTPVCVSIFLLSPTLSLFHFSFNFEQILN